MHKKTRVNLVAPSSPFENDIFHKAMVVLKEHNYEVLLSSRCHEVLPAFLSAHKKERLHDLLQAEQTECDAFWATRGGVGAIELISDYTPTKEKKMLVGFSDITILHLHRFLFDKRVGIHGPVAISSANLPINHEMLKMLIHGNEKEVSYPLLRLVNSVQPREIQGTLIVMNLSSLQTMLGSFDPRIFKGCILAIEDNNVKHYHVFRMLYQLKNLKILDNIEALILGHMQYDRDEIIEQTLIPLAKECDFPLFDFPYFGHDNPNLPLLFGADICLQRKTSEDFLLSYI